MVCRVCSPIQSGSSSGVFPRFIRMAPVAVVCRVSLVCFCSFTAKFLIVWSTCWLFW